MVGERGARLVADERGVGVELLERLACPIRPRCLRLLSPLHGVDEAAPLLLLLPPASVLKGVRLNK